MYVSIRNHKMTRRLYFKSSVQLLKYHVVILLNFARNLSGQLANKTRYSVLYLT
jgi:hypothetical protein